MSAIGQQDFILVNEKANKVSPMIARAYCLEAVSKPLLRMGEWKQSPVISLSWGGRHQNLGRPRRQKSASHTARKEGTKCKGDSGELQSLLKVFGWILSAHACEETTKTRERMHWAEPYLELTQNWEEFLSPLAHVKKLQNPQGLGWNSQKCQALVVGLY